MAMNQLTDHVLEEVTRSQWTDVLDEVLEGEPVARLEYDNMVMSTKLLGRRNRDDRSSTSLVIEPPDPDYSKAILGDRKVVQFYLLYYKDGFEYCVFFPVSFENYIIYNGYPAIVMTVHFPVRKTASVSVVKPNVSDPIRLLWSDGTRQETLLATEVSMDKVVPVAGEIAAGDLPLSSSEYRLELPGAGMIQFKGVVGEDTGQHIKITKIVPQARKKLNHYLEKRFHQTSEKRFQKEVSTIKQRLYSLLDESQGGTKKILFVDDQPDLLLPLMMLLENEGFEIELAENGEIGTKMARTTKPDLIILDVDMPRMNGLSVLKMLRKFIETKAIPILMLTGNASANTVTRAGVHGVSGYISKPYDAADVRRRVLEILEQT